MAEVRGYRREVDVLALVFCASSAVPLIAGIRDVPAACLFSAWVLVKTEKLQYRRT